MPVIKFLLKLWYLLEKNKLFDSYIYTRPINQAYNRQYYCSPFHFSLTVIWSQWYTFLQFSVLSVDSNCKRHCNGRKSQCLVLFTLMYSHWCAVFWDNHHDETLPRLDGRPQCQYWTWQPKMQQWLHSY